MKCQNLPHAHHHAIFISVENNLAFSGELDHKWKQIEECVEFTMGEGDGRQIPRCWTTHMFGIYDDWRVF